MSAKAKSWFTCKLADESEAEITIYDEIGMWGIDASDFHKSLKALGKVDSINLRINSPGGDVFQGLTIYNMLMRSKAHVTVTVDGIAASMASVIAMAGDVVNMPENSFLMIHDPFGVVVGNSKDMRALADTLDKIKSGLISAYTRKTGMDHDEIDTLMADETWFTANEAVEFGFADAVDEPVQAAASFDLNKFKNAPGKLGDKLRGKAALNSPTSKEPEMDPNTDDMVAASEQELAAKTEADVKAQAELDAKADADAKAVIEAKDSTDADALKSAADVVALCNEMGFADKAAEFVAAGTSFKAAFTALKELKATQAPAEEISAHNVPKAGGIKIDATAAWGKAIDTVNARLPRA